MCKITLSLSIFTAFLRQSTGTDVAEWQNTEKLQLLPLPTMFSFCQHLFICLQSVNSLTRKLLEGL